MRNKQSSCHPSFSLENVKGSSNYKINKSTSSLKPACQFGVMTFICLFPFSTFAECTPTPDCADMGYTETSCSGSFVRCPFDTSKLFCTPCDSIYQYSCTGQYTQGGAGSSCQNKYASCICNAGATFTDGNCVCDYSCSVGNIYYSDNSCSSCLETAKTPVGVVVKDNELIMSYKNAGIQWSMYEEFYDIPDLPNYDTIETAKADFNGIFNTQTIVNFFGSDADASTHAGVYCYNYAPNGLDSSKGQWYLPALGELNNYVRGNYNLLSSAFAKLSQTNIWSEYIWSSSEYDALYSWLIYIDSGNLTNFGKHNANNVFCFLKI